jgi:integration host factor subunit beta
LTIFGHSASIVFWIVHPTSPLTLRAGNPDKASAHPAAGATPRTEVTGHVFPGRNEPYPPHRRTTEDSMNKSELIKTLSEETNIPIEEAAMVVNTFVDSMKEALTDGDRVEIRGFGSFKVKDYGGYSGRNPKTGDMVVVQPKRLPFFRAGKELKEFLND